MHDVKKAVEILHEQGVKITVDPSRRLANIYTVSLPSGEYDLLDQHLTYLQTEGKLNTNGIEELHRDITKRNEKSIKRQ
jgi:hypothetical protein